jgi:RimJ/RimL family protein N-acetyltransferase
MKSWASDYYRLQGTSRSYRRERLEADSCVNLLQVNQNMAQIAETISFRPLVAVDLTMLHEWLHHPHVSQWWDSPKTYAEVERDYLPSITGESTTKAYIALLKNEPIGFIQSYVVMGSSDGWWEQETDPGARGIDLFLCNSEQLGQGLGSAMICAFVAQLFQDPLVTKVQIDPSPQNERAIRSYRRAGFVDVGEVVTPDGLALLMVKERSSDHFL